jgi:hypothetical protein
LSLTDDASLRADAVRADTEKMRKALLPLCLIAGLLAGLPATAAATGPRSIEQAKVLMRHLAPAYAAQSCKRANRGAIKCALYRDKAGWRHARRGTWATDGRIRISKSRRVCRVDSRAGQCGFKLKRR